ncbi:MAG: DUF5666 domain-containing protein [Armatimonadota bacterium]|nr:DUF5666 domain-containing protein [Armatimonadota bacterium]
MRPGAPALALVLVVLLAAGTVPALSLHAAPHRGKGRGAEEPLGLVRLRGVVVAVSPSVLTLRLAEGGTVTCRLVEGTRIGGRTRLVPGLVVEVRAVRVAGGLVALVVGVPEARGPARTARLFSATGAVEGVAIAVGERTVSVLRADNTLLTVLLTGTTQLRGAPSVPRLAVVEVVGTANADGSVSARTVTVRFDPRRATQVSGRVAVAWDGTGFVLSGGAIVTVDEETWVLWGAALRPMAFIAPGMRATVWGEGRPPVVAARVVQLAP